MPQRAAPPAHGEASRPESSWPSGKTIKCHQEATLPCNGTAQRHREFSSWDCRFQSQDLKGLIASGARSKSGRRRATEGEETAEARLSQSLRCRPRMPAAPGPTRAATGCVPGPPCCRTARLLAKGTDKCAQKASTCYTWKLCPAQSLSALCPSTRYPLSWERLARRPRRSASRHAVAWIRVSILVSPLASGSCFSGVALALRMLARRVQNSVKSCTVAIQPRKTQERTRAVIGQTVGGASHCPTGLELPVHGCT